MGKSILSWAKKKDNEEVEVIELLKEKGASEYEISKDEADGLSKDFWDEKGKLKSVEEIKKLIRQGANLDVYNESTQNQIWKDLKLDEMNEILKILPKGYEIEGDVNLSKCGLKKSPMAFFLSLLCTSSSIIKP